VTLSAQQVEELARAYDSDGYVVLRDVVSRERLLGLRDALLDEFARTKSAGQLFEGGGMFSGHLNCFPGQVSRFVFESLQDQGVIDLARKLSPQAVRLPNVGCNMNLPGSSAQNNHIDGYAATAFIIINVAAVDTDESNGAMELTPGSHKRDYKYWEFVLARRPARRMHMKAGDVVLRSSALWHRGMPNHSAAIRPMLGFTWEDGGSKLTDPYSVHDGKIRFLFNRYNNDLSGQLRERAFAKFPKVGSGYLFVRSLLQR
jgi:hypothetical protein